MPIYAYRCSSCGHAQDVLQRMSDPVLSICPACGQSTYVKQVTAAGFQLKGSGWYVTDFRGDKKSAPAADADKAGAKTGDAAAAGTTGGDAGAKNGDAGRKPDAAPSPAAAPCPAPAASAPATPGKTAD
jgi:putative FmdB family regulatory protein